MAKNPDKAGEYEVGYKKPPRHTRFRKGQSGNPGGRPKGTPNFRTALDRALKEQVIVNEGGRRIQMSKLEAMVKQHVNRAVGGDHRARGQLLKVLPLVDESFVEASPEVHLDAADETVLAHLISRIERSKREDPSDER